MNNSEKSAFFLQKCGLFFVFFFLKPAGKPALRICTCNETKQTFWYTIYDRRHEIQPIREAVANVTFFDVTFFPAYLATVL